MVMIGNKGQQMLSVEILYILVLGMKIFLSSSQEINFTGWIFPKWSTNIFSEGLK